ncbi:MAG: dinitrogenase iron-molybdenum cofactor biosynthesis protein [Candidatus Hydrogenedentes bacterium]|nr:dinitrogenase iron-molybdenum cofactor biosynthesis protein [Candidatus Hydrogenedentota bacterium]
MKLCLTTSGKDLDAPLDERFGRAPSFIVYDLDADTFELIDNKQNLNAAQGAGIQAAQTVMNSGAKAVITGHCGPKAFRVLSAAGIKLYGARAGTIAEAIQQYRDGSLTVMDDANVDGHWV